MEKNCIWFCILRRGTSRLLAVLYSLSYLIKVMLHFDNNFALYSAVSILSFTANKSLLMTVLSSLFNIEINSYIINIFKYFISSSNFSFHLRNWMRKIFHFHLLLCPNQPPCRLKCNHFMKFLFLLCNDFILFSYRLTIDIDEQKALFSLSFAIQLNLWQKEFIQPYLYLGNAFIYHY